MMSMLQQLSETEILQLKKCNTALAAVIQMFTSKVSEQNRTTTIFKLYSSFQLAIQTALGIRFDQQKIEKQIKNDPEALPELSYLFSDEYHQRTPTQILQIMSKTIARKLNEIVETSSHILTHAERDQLKLLAQQLD